MSHLPATISASQARTNFYDIIDEADKTLKKFVITRRGKAQAVIMSAREYEGWEETNEILADKELVKSIHQGEKEMKAGKVIPWEQAKKELGWK